MAQPQKRTVNLRVLAMSMIGELDLAIAAEPEQQLYSGGLAHAYTRGVRMTLAWFSGACGFVGATWLDQLRAFAAGSDADVEAEASFIAPYPSDADVGVLMDADDLAEQLDDAMAAWLSRRPTGPELAAAARQFASYADNWE